MERRPRQILIVASILVGTLATVSLLRLFASKPAERESPSAAPLVRVEIAQPQEFQFIVRAHGSVSPRTQSDLVPQVSGEVTWVARALVAGGFFERGDPLVKIDRADAEVDLETARANVARAESEFDRAETERKRQVQLQERSVASPAAMDDAENAFRVARAALREARARLSRAERDLARTVLRAPYDGRVRSEQVDVGQFVQRGGPIGKLYAVDYAEVRLPLPDRELAYVDVPLARNAAATPDSESAAPGPPVRLHANFAGHDRIWHGTIVRTEGELDPSSRMVHVVARVADPYGIGSDGVDAPLAVGLFVEAEIEGKRIDAAYVLPRTALRGDQRVYLIDDQSRLRFRDVEVLRAERGRVVIGAGLSPGDRVCVSPLSAVIDGMKVRVIDADEEHAGAGP